MDSLIAAAAGALAAGDTLGALKRVALRDDAPALALRGIAMAQLGEFARARLLLRAAGRSFGPREAVARSRCSVADAEIALVSRDLAWSEQALDGARAVLEAQGDRANAAHAHMIEARRMLLIGRLDAAETRLAALDRPALPPASRASFGLILAGIAVRRLQIARARSALAEAARAAAEAGIAALVAEVERAVLMLDAPAARLLSRGTERTVRLDEVEALIASDRLVVDACRHVLRGEGRLVPLGTRPVLFALARALAEAWPGDVPRNLLVARAFGGRHADESHRARLRVEIGRLRSALRDIADVEATKRGFALTPRGETEVVVLAPPAEGRHAALTALLADGEAWSSSALALALSASPRTVQRALEALAAEGSVQSFGRGRARRWLAPLLPGFPTVLLLPGPMPGS